MEVCRSWKKTPKVQRLTARVGIISLSSSLYTKL
jgi:hypothetical protein